MTHELDLIPASYRERLKIRRWCHLFMIIFAVLVVLIVIAKFGVSSQTNHFKTRLSKLQSDKSFNLQQQQIYNSLLIKQNILQKKLEILEGLRGGPTVQHILQVIDRVIDGSVWFTQWSFIRAGELTKDIPTKKQTGYFIIIPQNTAGNSNQQAWKLNTHMEINGQTHNHSYLSKFVSALIKEPEITDVQVIKTSLRDYSDYQLVNFNLVVVINNQEMNNDL